MNLSEFIEKFAEALDETDVQDITPETKFKELDEWSSLASLSIIAMVDEEYDVTLKGDDIKTANTVEDLFNVVKSKI